MTKGSRRCAVCRKQATGALLHYPHRNQKRWYGTYACQEHLEEATAHELSKQLHLPNLLLLAAKRLIPEGRHQWRVG